MKHLLTLLFASAITAGISNAATVTLQISSGSNNATGFADSLGSTADGLTWGVIVSTTDSVFTELAPGLVLSTTTDGISLGGGDFLFLSTNLTSTQSFGAEVGVQGKISTLTGLQMNLTQPGGANTVVTGNPYALIWFDRGIANGTTLEGGDKYGLITNAAFVIPAAGATANNSAPFAGTGDSVKSASTITLVPEPSALILGAIGALGLLRRRRI